MIFMADVNFTEYAVNTLRLLDSGEDITEFANNSSGFFVLVLLILVILFTFGVTTVILYRFVKNKLAGS